MIDNLKDIVGYEELYKVSSTGLVYSIKSSREIKPWITQHGYRQLRLCKDGVAKSYNICRLVAIAFILNPENKRCVNHKDGNKKNDCVDNLEWCTYSENTKHSFRLGLQSNKGEKHSSHKITESIVLDIRRDSWMGLSSLSELYNLSKSHLSGIINRRYWKHI